MASWISTAPNPPKARTRAPPFDSYADRIPKYHLLQVCSRDKRCGRPMEKKRGNE
jgi:hypothetical protein